MGPMTDLATPALADLQAWHSQQNPLIRALTEPLVARVGETLVAMQGVIDAGAAERQALTAQLIAAQEEIDAVRVEAQTQATEHGLALQVTKDRIDQLERHVFGKRSERQKKTPDARKEARKRRRGELAEEQRKAERETAARARQAKLDALRTKTVVLPLDPQLPPGRALPPRDR